ncbi:hypothetical protein BT69DRAFT_833243 [Atractiella rhizophila]|nr:hypothetical protein BT69DRAFT_833243 [Atractiella rhizophila]
MDQQRAEKSIAQRVTRERGSTPTHPVHPSPLCPCGPFTLQHCSTFPASLLTAAAEATKQESSAREVWHAKGEREPSERPPAPVSIRASDLSRFPVTPSRWFSRYDVSLSSPPCSSPFIILSSSSKLYALRNERQGQVESRIAKAEDGGDTAGRALRWTWERHGMLSLNRHLSFHLSNITQTCFRRPSPVANFVSS